MVAWVHAAVLWCVLDWESCGVRSLACRDGELSGVNCGEARALIGQLVRVGVGVETQTTALTTGREPTGSHVVDGTKAWPIQSFVRA
jgi:hypothetical protein